MELSLGLVGVWAAESYRGSHSQPRLFHAQYIWYLAYGLRVGRSDTSAQDRAFPQHQPTWAWSAVLNCRFTLLDVLECKFGNKNHVLSV